ncbi:hypothetical protein JCM11641_008029 [Rhodosporidiobolus odoratus]
MASSDPPPLTEEQKHRILTSPIHKRIKHQTYTVMALGLLGPIANLATLILGAVWARHILQTDRWFIFHYTVACTLSLMWAVYSYIFMRDIKYLGWPDQLQIDIGWMMFADGFNVCFLLYIFRKMRTYGVLDVFEVACSSGCTGKLNFVKISPIVLACTSFLFGCVQLVLTILLYKNPIINPPLDEHGMPVPQDPETGKPMPLGPDGKPIVPDWLKPPSSKTAKKSSQKKGVVPDPMSSGDEMSSDEEKRPLAASNAVPTAEQMELGRKRRSSTGRGQQTGRW